MSHLGKRSARRPDQGRKDSLREYGGLDRRMFNGTHHDREERWVFGPENSLVILTIIHGKVSDDKRDAGGFSRQVSSFTDAAGEHPTRALPLLDLQRLSWNSRPFHGASRR